MASDVADGQVARRFGKPTALGAKLDSVADLATWAFLPLCLFWLWPDVITGQAPWLAIAIAAFAAPTIIGLLRFGRLTSYHTYGAKICSWAMAIGALALVAAGNDALFHAAAVVLVLSAVEEVAITAVLPSWRADVPSLVHALHAREEA